MDKLQIEWGDLERTEAIESHVVEKSSKILSFAPTATNLIINLKTINNTQSAGVNTYGVTVELRLPKRQDVRVEKQGEDLYGLINESQRVILNQVKTKKDKGLI